MSRNVSTVNRNGPNHARVSKYGMLYMYKMLKHPVGRALVVESFNLLVVGNLFSFPQLFSVSQIVWFDRSGGGGDNRGISLSFSVSYKS